MPPDRARRYHFAISRPMMYICSQHFGRELERPARMTTEGPTAVVPSQTQTPQVVVQMKSQQPGMLLRIAWFLFVGWWACQVALLAAWAFTLLVITILLGMYILIKLPFVFTLRSAT